MITVEIRSAANGISLPVQTGPEIVTAWMVGLKFYSDDGYKNEVSATTGAVELQYDNGTGVWRYFDGGLINLINGITVNPRATGDRIIRVKALFDGVDAAYCRITLLCNTDVDASIYRLLVTNSLANPRIKVDAGQTGFFDRREFRISEELNIPSGTSLVYRFDSPVNFILWEQVLECDANLLKFEAIVGGTEGGVFTPVTIWGKNRMTEQPLYNYQVSIGKGGTVTGGQVAEVIRVQAANATAQRSSVGMSVGSERGLPPSVTHLKLSAIGGDVTGTFSLVWEERPL